MAKKKVVQPEQQKLSEMKDWELGVALNNQHNVIHQSQQQIAQASQNITSIMTEIEKRKNAERRIQSDLSDNG